MLKKLLIGTALVGAVAIGSAGSPANADTSTQDTQDFLAAVRAEDGISGDNPEILEDANEACWDLNVGNYGLQLTAANFRQDDPAEMPLEEAVAFVVDASRNYCPVATYDYWAYSVGDSGGGGAGG